jgi:hypothetical protein
VICIYGWREVIDYGSGLAPDVIDECVWRDLWDCISVYVFDVMKSTVGGSVGGSVTGYNTEI